MKYQNSFVILASLLLFSASSLAQAETNDCSLMKIAGSAAQGLKNIPTYRDSDDKTLAVIRDLNRSIQAGRQFSEFLKSDILPNLDGKGLYRKVDRIAYAKGLNQKLIPETDYPELDSSCLGCGFGDGTRFYIDLLVRSIHLSSYLSRIAGEVRIISEIVCD